MPSYQPAKPDVTQAAFESQLLPGLPREQIGAALLVADPASRISLQPLTSTVSKEELRQLYPERKIIACDFHVSNIEKSTAVASGFYCKDSDILNIDHHAPAKQMFRFVSSGTLAIEYVAEHGKAPDDAHIVLNHTDCDSIISSLIVGGFIPPAPDFNEAVIAADHTGALQPIADLLQALDVRRDVNFSARNLGLLLAGEPLEASAQKLLDARMKGREETRAAMYDGDALLERGELSVVRISANMRNEFMADLIPEAMIILTCEPGKTEDTWVARFRLGKAAPAGFTILDLNLSEFDQAYGGRWNAGSNKRGGGTTLPLAEYISRTERNLQAALARRG